MNDNDQINDLEEFFQDVNNRQIREMAQGPPIVGRQIFDQNGEHPFYLVDPPPRQRMYPPLERIHPALERRIGDPVVVERIGGREFFPRPAIPMHGGVPMQGYHVDTEKYSFNYQPEYLSDADAEHNLYTLCRAEGTEFMHRFITFILKRSFLTPPSIMMDDKNQFRQLSLIAAFGGDEDIPLLELMECRWKINLGAPYTAEAIRIPGIVVRDDRLPITLLTHCWMNSGNLEMSDFLLAKTNIADLPEENYRELFHIAVAAHSCYWIQQLAARRELPNMTLRFYRYNHPAYVTINTLGTILLLHEHGLREQIQAAMGSIIHLQVCPMYFEMIALLVELDYDLRTPTGRGSYFSLMIWHVYHTKGTPIDEVIAEIRPIVKEKYPSLTAEEKRHIGNRIPPEFSWLVAPLELPPLQLSDEALAADCPPEFVCPCSKLVMRDPVFDAFGFSHDRGALLEWLSNGQNVSPITGEKYPSKMELIPNRTLRTQIREWAEREGYLPV